MLISCLNCGRDFFPSKHIEHCNKKLAIPGHHCGNHLPLLSTDSPPPSWEITQMDLLGCSVPGGTKPTIGVTLGVCVLGNTQYVSSVSCSLIFVKMFENNEMINNLNCEYTLRTQVTGSAKPQMAYPATCGVIEQDAGHLSAFAHTSLISKKKSCEWRKKISTMLFCT